MTDLPQTGDRLDSWKAIATSLQRDAATARRWEKTLGLPVHRVAGNGRSVFAYTSEIDLWLRTRRPAIDQPVVSDPPAVAPPTPPTRIWHWVGLTAALIVLVILVARPPTIAAEDVRVELTPAGVVARDSEGAERWSHAFPNTHQTFMPPEPVQVLGGATPGVYLATAYRMHGQAEERVEGGVLTLFDLEGRPRQSFSFSDEVNFGGTSYGPPWAITGFAVNDTDEHVRVAVTAHHYTWDPGVVTILDDRWQRLGTFVHAGWLEQVRWLGPERLVVAGFSNAREGGMVALLDATKLAGQGPEPADSRHYCKGCGDGGPLRMVVFPRTEVNLASASRFNRARVQIGSDGRLSAHTGEMHSAVGDASAIFEFSPSLDLVSARFSERYWDLHKSLEAEGKIAPTPARNAPTAMDPGTSRCGLRSQGGGRFKPGSRVLAPGVDRGRPISRIRGHLAALPR